MKTLIATVFLLFSSFGIDQRREITSSTVTIKERGEGLITIYLKDDDILVKVPVIVDVPYDTLKIGYKKY